MHTKQTFTIIAALATVLTAATADASARTSRVAVTPFAGPGDVARSAHEAVVEITGRHYDVVPSIEILEASAEAGADARSPKAAMRVARLTGADVVVIGRVAPSGDGYKLTLSVRQATSGRSVGAVLIPMFTESVEQSAYDQIKPLLLHLLKSVRLARSPRADTRPAVAERPSSDDVDAEVEDDEDEDEEEEIDLPFHVVAAAGLSATARRLSFSQEAGLGLDGVSGNPTPALRVEGEARTKGEDNLAVAFRVDRSVGGKVAVQQTGGVEIPLTQSQWGIDLRGRKKIRRFEAMATLGYNELSYQLTLPPEGLMLPSASYAFLNIGGGVATEVADGAVRVQLSGRYLHVLSSSGITDPGKFGAATSRGVDAEIGIEIRASDSVFVRFGASHLHLVHNFDGSGALISMIDDDPEPDVAGAVDAFTSGFAQLAFLL